MQKKEKERALNMHAGQDIKKTSKFDIAKHFSEIGSLLGHYSENMTSHASLVIAIVVGLFKEEGVVKTNGYLDSIKKVRQFMFDDLGKTINLVNTKKGAPNFLLALALCCYNRQEEQFKL